MELAQILDGYVLGKLLGSTDHTRVHEGTRAADGRPVVLKVHHGPRGSEAAQVGS